MLEILTTPIIFNYKIGKYIFERRTNGYQLYHDNFNLNTYRVYTIAPYRLKSHKSNYIFVYIIKLCIIMKLNKQY